MSADNAFRGISVKDRMKAFQQNKSVEDKENLGLSETNERLAKRAKLLEEIVCRAAKSTDERPIMTPEPANTVIPMTIDECFAPVSNPGVPAETTRPSDIAIPAVDAVPAPTSSNQVCDEPNVCQRSPTSSPDTVHADIPSGSPLAVELSRKLSVGAPPRLSIRYRPSVLARKPSIAPPPLPKGKAAPPPVPKGKAAPPPLISQAPAVTALKPVFVSGFAPTAKSGLLWVRGAAMQGETPWFSESEICALFEPAKIQAAVVPKVAMPVLKSLSVLDSRKGRNMEISFRQFRSPQNLHAILVAAELSSLSPDDVALLLREYPSEELRAKMERLDSEHPDLDWETPEQYLLAMTNVPNCRALLNAWSFALGVAAAVGGFSQQLKEIKNACTSVIAAGSLVSLTQTLLQVANRLNAGTARGGQAALAFESLGQFEELRAPGDAAQTALGFAVSVWRKTHAQPAARFSSELAAVSRLSPGLPALVEIEMELAKLTSDSEAAAAFANACREQGADEIAARVESGAASVAEAQAKAKEARGAWTALVEFLGLKPEAPAARNSRELFDLIQKLTRQVEKHLN